MCDRGGGGAEREHLRSVAVRCNAVWAKEAEAVGMLLIKEELVSEARRKNMLYINRHVYVEETQEARPPPLSRLVIVFEFLCGAVQAASAPRLCQVRSPRRSELFRSPREFEECCLLARQVSRDDRNMVSATDPRLSCIL